MQSQQPSWLQSIKSGLKSLLSKTKETPPVDGRPTHRQLELKQRRKSGISKRRKVYPVHNPSLIELNQQINEYRQKNPYGVCSVCNKNTHITEDHDAVVKLARQKAQSKRKRTIAAVGMKKTRGHNWTIKRRPLPKRKPIEISPFSCLDDAMKVNPMYRFDDAAFDKAWDVVSGCVSARLDQNPDLLNALTRTGEMIEDSTGKYRVYRDDWKGCCPPVVKDIAREMAHEFMEHGVIMWLAISRGIQYLYCCICYAVIRIYLDHLEWEDMHRSYEFEECMDALAQDVKPYGERLVGAIMTNELICDKMRLGKYSGRIVDAVRHEGEEGEEWEDE